MMPFSRKNGAWMMSSRQRVSRRGKPQLRTIVNGHGNENRPSGQASRRWEKWQNAFLDESETTMKKPAQSAQYCRICNATHQADGICSQHHWQVRKTIHTLEKRAGKGLKVRQH